MTKQGVLPPSTIQCEVPISLPKSVYRPKVSYRNVLLGVGLAILTVGVIYFGYCQWAHSAVDLNQPSSISMPSPGGSKRRRKASLYILNRSIVLYFSVDAVVVLCLLLLGAIRVWWVLYTPNISYLNGFSRTGLHHLDPRVLEAVEATLQEAHGQAVELQVLRPMQTW